MNSDIVSLLENAGFRGILMDGVSISMEDPTCIMRFVGGFIDLCWIGLYFVVGLFLFGYAIAIIRGGKITTFFENTKNIFLILAILAMTKPIANFIYGKDLWHNFCRTITVSVSDVQKIIDSKDSKFLIPVEPVSVEEVAVDEDIEDQSQAPGGIISVEESSAPSAQPASTSAPVAQRESTGAGATEAVSAQASGKSVIYDFISHKIKKYLGTLAWRNNNPGNISCSAFSRNHNGIACNGRWGIFSSPDTGFNAIKSLLKTKNYQNKTVGGAIAKWAPPSENNTSGYQAKIVQQMGISLDTPMSSLTEDQLEKMAQTIRRIEGWKPGSEERL